MTHFRAEDTVEESLKALAIRLDGHLKEFEAHKEDVASTLRTQTATLQQNTAAITALTEALAKLTEATTGVVAAYNTANNVQRFVKWLAAFGVLAAVMSWASKLITTHFGG